jgi:peptide/nickel transport system substrate-binding protein
MDPHVMPEKQTAADVTRRKWLKAVGGGSAALVAGCAGDGGDGGGDGGDGGDGGGDGGRNDSDGGGDGGDGGGSQVLDTTFEWGNIGNTTQMNFNVAALKNASPGEVNTLIWDTLAVFRPFSGDYRNEIATDWSIDGKTLAVTMSEDYVWEDGDDLTAEHVALNLRLLEIQGTTLWNFAESVSAAGDYTVEVQMGEVNPELALVPALDNIIWAKGDAYTGFVQSYSDASTDEERKSVRQNLFQHTDDSPIANGPFRLDDIDSQRAIFKRRGDHPRADQINFTTCRGRAGTNENTSYQAGIANEIDAISGNVPPQIREKLGNNWQFTIHPAGGGHATFFNFNEAPYDDRNVRKAIAHVTNEQKYNRLLGELTHAVPTVSDGLTNAVTSNWLSEDFVGKLEDYSGSNTEKAAEYLEKAGYSKSGGTWKRDGKPLQAPFKYPSSWSSGITAWQGLVEDWNDFGLQAEGIGQESSTYIGNTLPQSDFLIADFVVGSNQPHPFFHFRGGYELLSQQMNLIPGDEDWVVEVPKPIGDPEGSLEEVNVTQQYLKLRTQIPQEEQQAIVEELAWTINQFVPYQQTTNDQRNQPLNNQKFSYGISPEDNDDRIIQPDEADPNLHVSLPHSHGIVSGVIKAKE